jgi:hypothetical protein
MRHLLLLLALGLLLFTVANCQVKSEPKPPVVDMSHAHVTYDKSVN